MTATPDGHERVYRSLLRLYPAEYRARFGDQMVQLFGDQRRDAGSTHTWLGAIGDLATSATAEHLRRNRRMAHSISVAPTPTGRLLGLLGVIGGLALVAALVVQISSDLFNLRLVLFNVGAIAVVLAVHHRQSATNPRLALAGAIPAIVANVAYLVLIVRLVAVPGELGLGDYGPFIGYTASAMWLADAWFGIVTFKLGKVARISAVALIAGSLFAFVGQGYFGLVQQGTLLETVVLSGVALHGLAWIALGLEVALRRRLVPASEG